MNNPLITDEQRIVLGEFGAKRVRDRPPSFFANAKGMGNRRWDELRIAHVGE